MDKEKMDKKIKRLENIIDEMLFRISDTDEDMISIHDLKYHLTKSNLMNQDLENSIDEFRKYYEVNYYEDMTDKIIEELL